MRTGSIAEGPFSYTWSFPICPYQVRMDLSIVEDLQPELAETHEPRQGLLIGQKGPGLTQIDGRRALPAPDADCLRAAVAAAPRAVGYYIIREGSAFLLAPAEAALASEFFTQGSVVLLIERRRKGPAEATFFFWRGDVFVHNLPLPFPFHAGLLSGRSPLSPAAAAAPPMPRPDPGQRRAFRIGVCAVAGILAGGVAASYLRDAYSGPPRRPLPAASPGAFTAPASMSETPTWIATQPKRDLELTWDPRSEPVATATAGVLKIEDGGVTRQMALDVGELLLGSILYAPTSERIRIELATLQRDGKMALARVGAQPAPPPSTPVASLPIPDEASVPKAGLLGDADRKISLPDRKADPAVERRQPLRRFTWTSAERIAPSASMDTDVPLHQGPPPVSPAVLTATLPPGLPAPTLPVAPPPKPAPAPAPSAPVRVVPRSGRIIWTGTLQRHGVVELDGRVPTLGALSGVLPGVPVNISVTPAEFGEEGLMVYTTEAARHNRVEPPSAANGWNKITYVWDPERVKQLAVLEYPNNSNGYNRMALRNDARRCSASVRPGRLLGGSGAVRQDHADRFDGRGSAHKGER